MLMTTRWLVSATEPFNHVRQTAGARASNRPKSPARECRQSVVVQ